MSTKEYTSTKEPVRKTNENKVTDKMMVILMDWLREVIRDVWSKDSTKYLNIFTYTSLFRCTEELTRKYINNYEMLLDEGKETIRSTSILQAVGIYMLRLVYFSLGIDEFPKASNHIPFSHLIWICDGGATMDRLLKIEKDIMENNTYISYILETIKNYYNKIEDMNKTLLLATPKFRKRRKYRSCSPYSA